jgi:hypothetical protein
MDMPCYEICEEHIEAKKERDDLLNDLARLKMLVDRYFKAQDAMLQCDSSDEAVTMFNRAEKELKKEAKE